MRKIVIILLGLMVLISFSGNAFAMCGMCGSGDTKTQGHSHDKAVDVGNTTCPITDEKIDPKTKITYEYEGKIYNFCCPACVPEFKKDPKKYIEKIETEKAK